MSFACGLLFSNPTILPTACTIAVEELTAKYGDTLKVVANEEDSILDMYTGARTAMIVIIYVISILFSLVVVMMFCKKAFLQERRDIGIYKSLGFTSGKYAFVTQGNWIGATMTSSLAAEYAAAGNFKCGMVPYAFNESADTILVNSPSWWAVYNGPKQDAAKAFLQWCSEAKAQEVLVLEAGFISPFKSCTIAANDPLAATVMDHMARGKTSSWGWLKLPEGLSMNYTGQLFADFAGGALDVEGFVNAMVSVVDSAIE